MKFTPISSSNIKAAAHEDGDLFIEFNHGGAVYRYPDVPVRVFNELVAAPSAGKFFSSQIRNAYPCEKVERVVG